MIDFDAELKLDFLTQRQEALDAIREECKKSFTIPAIAILVGPAAPDDLENTRVRTVSDPKLSNSEVLNLLRKVIEMVQSKGSGR